MELRTSLGLSQRKKPSAKAVSSALSSAFLKNGTFDNIIVWGFLLFAGYNQNIQLIIVVVRYPQDQPWQYPEECDDLIQRWSHESLAGHIHLISALICEHPKFKVIQFVCLVFYWCNRTLRKQKILHSWHSVSPGGSSGYVELHLGTWPMIYAFQSTWIFWQSLMLIHWAAFQMSHSFWCLVCFFLRLPESWLQ